MLGEAAYAIDGALQQHAVRSAGQRRGPQRRQSRIFYTRNFAVHLAAFDHTREAVVALSAPVKVTLNRALELAVPAAVAVWTRYTICGFDQQQFDFISFTRSGS